MSRDASPPEPDEPPPTPEGHVRGSAPGPLVTVGLVALVLGWSIRPLALRTDRMAPSVPGLAVALIAFAAALVGVAAYSTWRTVHRDGARLSIDHGVNRLVLGKACAVVGAILAGGYAGNAIAHLGVADAHARGQVFWSLGASVAGLALLVAALLLERACRVPEEPR